MKFNIHTDDGYWTDQRRFRELRDAFAEFLNEMEFHFFVTLATNAPGDFWRARDKFKHFLQRIDRQVAGRNAHRNPSRRVFAVAALEHPNTNLHLHALLRMPSFAPNLPAIAVTSTDHPDWKATASYWIPKFDRAWGSFVPQGDCKTLPYRQGATEYTLKGAHVPAAYEQLMFSTEF